MRKKRTTFSSEFKMQVVLESFNPDISTTQLAEKYNISVKNIFNWKNHFLSNAHLAFDATPSNTMIERLKSENNELEDMLTKRIKERDEGMRKLRGLDISTKKKLIETSNKELSIVQQCKIIGLNRPSLYYAPKPAQKNDEAIMKRILEILQTTTPTYGYRKMHQQLLKDGYKIGVNKVHKLMKAIEAQEEIKPPHKSDTTRNATAPSMHLLHDLALVRPFKI